MIPGGGLLGYRLFRVGESGHILRAAFQEINWDPGMQPDAICVHEKTYGPHDVPVADSDIHRCGYHAYWSSTRAANHLVVTDQVAVAAVVGFGRISIEELGWRSQRAQIVALTHCNIAEMPELAERYGVPLVPFHELPAVAGEFATYTETNLPGAERDIEVPKPAKNAPAATSSSSYARVARALSGGLYNGWDDPTGNRYWQHGAVARNVSIYMNTDRSFTLTLDWQCSCGYGQNTDIRALSTRDHGIKFPCPQCKSVHYFNLTKREFS